MRFDHPQYLIQPAKHIVEKYIGMGLAGIENHIGEDGHNLLEILHFF